MDRRQRYLIALGAGFLAYAGASLLWSKDPLFGGLWLASLAAAYLLGGRVRNPEFIWAIFIVGVALNLAFALAWPKDTALDLSFGFFGNANFFGCALAMALAAALAYRFIWFIPVGVLGLAWTQSRGAIAASAVVLAAGVWKWNRVVALGLLLALAVIAFSVSSGRDASFWARLGIWQDTVDRISFFGAGFGSFFDSYWSWPVHRNMTGIRAQHVYNDALELIYELGIGVVLLWVFLALALDRPGPGRLICLSFILCSLTFFPLFLAPLGQLFAFALGTLKEPEHGTLETNCAALPQR